MCHERLNLTNKACKAQPLPYRILLGIVSAFLLSCHNSTPPATVASVDPFAKPAPRSREADDAGRFLAGLAGRPDSPFEHLEEDASWRVHQTELDTNWKEIEAAWIPQVRRFAESELSGSRLQASVVFYPFSGPDALTPTLLFPNSSTYVLIGLEPAGTLPLSGHFDRRSLPTRLERVRGSVYSKLHRSFFITREMDRQFRGQVSDGLLEPILHLLVRTNHTVLGYRYVRVDDAGRIVTRDARYRQPGHFRSNGVQIDFCSQAGKQVQKLYYFSVNLSDERLGENRPFLAFLATLNSVTTLLKATSYMPHRPDFGIICKQILENSSAILQDDSGLPYRVFAPAAWQITLFGSYSQPYGSFRWREQPDLKEAFRTSGPKPLSFRIGYGFSQVPSNLLLAIRRDASRGKQQVLK